MKELLLRFHSWREERRKRKHIRDFDVELVHEKIDALAEKMGYEFYKPRKRDYLGYMYHDRFVARKKRVQ